jgi:hypothetical protein
MKNLILFLLLAQAGAPLLAGETGCVYDLNGTAQVQKAGGAEWSPVRKGLPLAEGDRLRTGPQAWCELLFKDGTFVKMEADSETALESLKATAEERVFSFSFLKGRALWMAARLKGKLTSKFSVRTPSAVCAVRGTDFSVAVSTSGETSIGLFEGKVAVAGGSGEQELLAGGEASAGPGGVAVQARMSRLMKAEERRYARLKGRVEALRKRLAERDGFLDEYIARQEKALADFEKRRQDRLGKR